MFAKFLSMHRALQRVCAEVIQDVYHVLLKYRPGGYVGAIASEIFLVQRAIGIIPINVQGAMSSRHVMNTLFEFFM
jgi:hypothetical protein